MRTLYLLPYKILLAFILLFSFQPAALAQFWNTPILSQPPTGINIGRYTSLQMVNGKPAISYYDLTNGDLIYLRANNISGTSWGSPVSIDVTGTVGQFTSLQMVNGNPAISYYDVTNLDLKYVRATDASGTAWASPISIDVTGSVGAYTSLQMVNGNPAISYYDGTNQDLKYVRATNASGTVWASPVSIDMTGNVGQYTSLQIVNGNPAISYYDVTNGDLKYVRATDASGTTWGSPVSVDMTGTVGQYNSLKIVNGNPAISYYDATNGFLKYVRATDAGGMAWAAPVILDGTSLTGQFTSMIGGATGAIIAYFNQTLGLPYFVTTTSFTILPLHLLSFTGIKQTNYNLLQWKTTDEINTKNFIVERSTDGINFAGIATVNAKGAGNNSYNYDDVSPTDAVIYYRLKMVDADGKSTYSNIIRLTVKQNNSVSIYPNPAEKTIMLNVTDKNLFNTSASISDLKNNKVKQFIITAYQQMVDISTLPAGMYILRLADGTFSKIIKQ